MWGILDLLIEAAFTRYKLPLLEQSNLRLQKLRFLARVCKDRQCLSLSAAHRNCLASLASWGSRCCDMRLRSPSCTGISAKLH